MNKTGSSHISNAPAGYAMPMMAIIKRPVVVIAVNETVVTLANLKHRQWNHGKVVFRLGGGL